jgi:uncharacterized LabA/DUF88 family protein
MYAILLDGGFVCKKLRPTLAPVQANGVRPHVGADDLVALCDRIALHPQLNGYELLRIYYYDAAPADGRTALPVSGAAFDLTATDTYRASQSLQSQLVLKPHFSLRMGHVQLSPQRWRIKESVARQLRQTQRALVDDDYVLDLKQKGVDMRIGMDMARLALRELVRTVVVVTGDGDFVPALKFVRREGIKVFLDPMDHNVRDLREHADLVIDPSLAMPAIP